MGDGGGGGRLIIDRSLGDGRLKESWIGVEESWIRRRWQRTNRAPSESCGTGAEDGLQE